MSNPLLTGVSAGRPAVVIQGSDGDPMRFSLLQRESTSAPGRVKHMLVFPMLVEVEGCEEPRLVGCVATEWRMELS